MDQEESKNLAQKLREAGTSGKKIHVISRNGTWVLINESSNRAIAKFKFKQQATKRAKSLLKDGITEVVISHKTDGSIDNIYPQSTELQLEAVR